MKRKLVITIDGPSGSGKSTAARELARRLGFLYLDTGAMYRAVAFQALRRRVPLADARALTRLTERSRITFRRAAGGRNRVFLDGEEVTRRIRRPEVSTAASRVALVPGVRRALVREQQRLGRRGGLVAEGRDAGTVVFPRAPLKFFITASAAERARRRHAEERQMGHRVSRTQVLREIRARDRRDRGRKVAPLRPAPGAIRIDNTRLQARQVLAILSDYVQGAKSRAPRDG
ncbi:MAG: (d)CMP kinase [Candidatus Omnitrophica bacterium]|nr:(d)CMP kinase [Candidatus Omnitrophota bacterium]